jgi:hypothetical protein
MSSLRDQLSFKQGASPVSTLLENKKACLVVTTRLWILSAELPVCCLLALYHTWAPYYTLKGKAKLGHLVHRNIYLHDYHPHAG